MTVIDKFEIRPGNGKIEKYRVVMVPLNDEHYQVHIELLKPVASGDWYEDWSRFGNVSPMGLFIELEEKAIIRYIDDMVFSVFNIRCEKLEDAQKQFKDYRFKRILRRAFPQS